MGVDGCTLCMVSIAGSVIWHAYTCVERGEGGWEMKVYWTILPFLSSLSGQLQAEDA